MNDATMRLGLPFLDAGQAAKELTHNEALVRLDLAVQASVVSVGVDDPPRDPAIGDAWVVGTAPTGAWAGHRQCIAGWTPGGWRFVSAVEGMSAWVASAGLIAMFRDGAWVVGDLSCRRVLVDGVPVLGGRAAAIPDSAGGATIDVEARAAVGAILGALRHHGLIATA